MRDLTEDQILQHLRQNTVGRNNQLSILVKMLNSARSNTVLAIDGSWGSGKTVFVRQLCMLADKAIEDYGRNTLDDVEIAKLRKNQKVFYFNAWENDYINDALGAILLKLIADHDESLNLASIKRAATMINLSAGIKNVSRDFINFNANTRKDKLVADIKERVDRHEAVNEFIDNLKGDTERLVFVIDELDRCRPSFAVDILEIIKHYFTRDDITFILTTNAVELSHTIRKYYGNEFDGSAYLNKFFDFSYHLNNIDTDAYARATLNWTFNGGMVSGVASDAISHFKFQMREINAYISALKLVEGFLNTSRSFAFDPMDDAFVKGLMVPFALALKIKNDGSFLEFVDGTEKGAQILRVFTESTTEMKDFAKQIELKDVSITSSDTQYEKRHMDEFIEKYRSMFKNESMNNRMGRYLRPFQQVVSLLSSYTIIKEPQEEKE